MADSSKESHKSHQEEWTLVSSKGEIEGVDEDSESSASSIEIVDVDADQVLSSHSSCLSKKVVVYKPDAESNDESEVPPETTQSLLESSNENSDENCTNEVLRIEENRPVSDGIADDGNIIDALMETTDGFESEKLEKEEDAISLEDSEIENEEQRSLSSICREKDATEIQCTEEESDSSPFGINLETDQHSPLDDRESSPEFISTAVGIAQITTMTGGMVHDLDLGTVEGACCAELMAESLDVTPSDQGPPEEACSGGPDSVSQNESQILQPAERDPDSLSQGSRSETDSDSDFICLDRSVPEDLENVAHALRQENSEERVLIPLRLSRSNSSIGPSFNFMREEAAGLPERSHSDEDEDRDDDTESSAEDSIDDRIESEQSEVGSDPLMNDVGDLSSFGDIGDLPLVAGDVARNYIHQPNQHLTTILNMILVLAAFLTMGLSLGIMMATDLEIEEWQNAYEMQTKKVSELRSELEKSKATYQTELLQKTKEIEHLQWDLYALQSAAELMSRYEPDDPDFAQVVQSFDLAVKSLSKCNNPGRSGWLKAPFCYLDKQEQVKQLKSQVQAYSSTLSSFKHKFQDEDSVQYIPSPQDKTQAESIKPYESVVDSVSLNLEDADKDQIVVESFDKRDHILIPALKVKPEAEESKETAQKEGPTMNDGAKLVDLLHTRDAANEVIVKDSVLKYIQQSDEEVKEKERINAPESRDNQPSASVRTEAHAAKTIPLDIKQLQQSLSLEQERALYWQQLYLAERRQREHERENEMWEDQRDRERWEQEEREKLDKVECLQKLMSTNLTTLTQYLTGWNVSVYDDFANLSMLMSTVADLRKSVVDSVHRVVEGAEEVYEKIKQEGKKTVYSEAWRDAMPAKEMILSYVNKLFEDVEQGVNDVIQDGEKWEEKAYVFSEVLRDKDEESQKSEKDGHSKTFEFGEEDGIPKGNDNSNIRWSNGFSKFLSKTRKSVGKLGKKVTSVVRHLRDMWVKKKPVIATMAKEFSGKVVKITEKFVKHLGKGLNIKLFKDASSLEKGDVLIDIHNKEVRNLRRQWQKQVMKYPCEVLGDYSAECNMAKKERKENLQAIREDFKKLLGLKVHIENPKSALPKIGTKKMKEIKESFNSFLTEWRENRFLLKTDLIWVECHAIWWSQAVRAMAGNTVGQLPENSCNLVHLSILLKEESEWLNYQDADNGPDMTQESQVCYKGSEKEEEDNDDDDVEGEVGDDAVNDDPIEISRDAHSNIDDDTIKVKQDDVEVMLMSRGSLEEGLMVENQGEISRPNETHTDIDEERISSRSSYTGPKKEDTEVWDHDRAKYRLQLRREKEKTKQNTASHKRLKFKRHEAEFQDWSFEKARGRQHLREQAEKSDWQFERAKARRFEKKKQDYIVYKEKDDDDRDENQQPNWFLDQAKERQRLREKEHESDWLFERASDRRKQHHLWEDHHKKKQGWNNGKSGKHSKHHRSHNGQKQDKHQFRHSYGKVVTP